MQHHKQRHNPETSLHYPLHYPETAAQTPPHNNARRGLACSLIILGLCGAPLFASAAMQEEEVQEFIFDNGLKLLVKEDHRAPVVISQIWYKVGGSYELAGTTGISHALEHMMFQGTEKYPEGEFLRIIAENGGRNNAFTSADYTAYFQILEKSRLAVSFELEADRMRNLIINQADFEKEIEVVKEERRLRTEDQPNAYLYEVAMATAWQTSPYRNPVVGWMADLHNMTVSDLEQWYQLWYAPNNATVVVAGDVKGSEVYALAKRYFADLKPEQIVPPRVQPEIEQNGIKRVVVRRAAKLPSLLMVYKTPGLKTALDSEQIQDWEPYALDVLSHILSGGNSARFAARLVRGAEVASTLGSSYSLSNRLDGTFIISGTPGQGRDLQQLEAAVREQITLLQTEPVTVEELQRVKAQTISSDVYEKDSLFYQALVLGVFETNGLGWRLADEYVDNIKAVTAEQLMYVADKYLRDKKLTVAELQPESDNPAQMDDGHAH
ncbi:MAG: M16 family metallopeptidase [Gammaproteobacteria bacterium]